MFRAAAGLHAGPVELWGWVGACLPACLRVTACALLYAFTRDGV
jgi:hypothetical protein